MTSSRVARSSASAAHDASSAHASNSTPLAATAIAAERKLLTVPADAGAAAALAPRYANAALGDLGVVRSGRRTVFDFGEWQSEMATRRNPDGTISFVTIAPGITGLEFVVAGGEPRRLVIRDAQHEYVFEER